MKRRRDLRLLAAAVVLLLVCAAWFAWSTREVERRREVARESVPDFPTPGQAPVRPRAADKTPRRMPTPQQPPAAPQAPRHDPIQSLALAGGNSNVAVVQVNALLNSPLFDRLRQCMPAEFEDLEKGGRDLGVDFTRDVDRVVISSAGMGMSGFFEGKPVAERMAGAGARRDEYRGAAIYTQDGRSCIAQLGNLLLTGGSSGCRALVDAALSPTPENAQEQIYGDLFVRSDLAFARQGSSDQVQSLLAGLSGATVRANVWDSVALTIEGTSQPGQNMRDLSAMARGAISMIKSQIDDEDVEYRALADFAKVADNPERLEINLALPAQDLFDKLHFPCPGRDGGI